MHRVLLIEDDATLGEVYALALEKMGLIVHIATSGAQGIQHFKNSTKFPSLLVVDDNLPDMRGVDMIRRVPRLNELKVLLIVDEIPAEGTDASDLVDGFILREKDTERMDTLVKQLLPQV